MSEQTTLHFVPVTPVARTTDPKTSHLSGKRITRDGTRARQADAILWLVKNHPGKTANELGQIAQLKGAADCLGPNRDPYGPIRRRLPELADPKNGSLVLRGEPRHCHITGRLALTWLPAQPR